jgi:hypothetical protein
MRLKYFFSVLTGGTLVINKKIILLIIKIIASEAAIHEKAVKKTIK